MVGPAQPVARLAAAVSIQLAAIRALTHHLSTEPGDFAVPFAALNFMAMGCSGGAIDATAPRRESCIAVPPGMRQSRPAEAPVVRVAVRGHGQWRPARTAVLEAQRTAERAMWNGYLEWSTIARLSHCGLRCTAACDALRPVMHCVRRRRDRPAFVAGWGPQRSDTLATMSYDLRLFGEPREIEPIRSALRATVGETLSYGDGDQSLQVDLYFADDDGNAITAATPGTINRADIHCGSDRYGMVSSKVVQLAVAVAKQVIGATGWTAHDPQRDEPFDAFDHPWWAECVPAAHQIGSIERAADGLLIHTAPYVGAAARWALRLGQGVLSHEPAARSVSAMWSREATTSRGDVLARTHAKGVTLLRAPGSEVIAEIKRVGRVRWLGISPDDGLLALTSDTPRMRFFTLDGVGAGSLVAPGLPRIWECFRGKRIDSKESGRRVSACAFIDATRFACAFSDGRVCFYDMRRQRLVAQLALLNGGRWFATDGDGRWDCSAGMGDDVDAFQWAWQTDARTYRDVIEPAPDTRRPGLLADV